MKYLLISLFLLLAITAYSQPRNIQVKLLEVKEFKGRKIEAKGLTMQGDTVYLKLKVSSPKFWKVGKWVTVWADYVDKECIWVCRRIKLNH